MKMTLNEEIELLRNGKWFDKIVGTLPNDEYLNLGWAIGDVLDTLESLRMLQPKVETNADRIRAMSDDSLLEFFANLAGNVGCPPGSHGKCGEKRQYGDDACRKCWEEYLQQPAEEET